MKLSIMIGLSALGLAMAMAPVGSAAAVEYQQGASGSCNGALPVFDQALRFRPVGVKNTGSSNAFISCSSMNLYTNGSTIFGAFIANNTGADVDVSCTLVSGRASFSPQYFPKTQTYAAGSFGFMIWNSATDNGGVDFSDSQNLSCVLPPGIDLQYTAMVVNTNL